jgi:hypothetical protein
MSDLSRIRVSDADRNHVIDRLQQATSEGRLSLDELDDRITDAMAARTWSDLDPLVDDLPAAPEAAGVEAGPATEPSVSPAVTRAAAAAVLGMGALSIPLSFWSAWGNVLGVVAVVLGVVTLLSSGHLAPRTRGAILSGVALGLLPTTFYVGLFLILGL